MPSRLSSVWQRLVSWNTSQRKLKRQLREARAAIRDHEETWEDALVSDQNLVKAHQRNLDERDEKMQDQAERLAIQQREIDKLTGENEVLKHQMELTEAFHQKHLAQLNAEAAIESRRKMRAIYDSVEAPDQEG